MSSDVTRTRTVSDYFEFTPSNAIERLQIRGGDCQRRIVDWIKDRMVCAESNELIRRGQPVVAVRQNGSRKVRLVKASQFNPSKCTGLSRQELLQILELSDADQVASQDNPKKRPRKPSRRPALNRRSNGHYDS